VIASERLVGPIRLLYTELTFQGVNISAASLHRHNRSTPGFLRVKHREDLSLGVNIEVVCLSFVDCCGSKIKCNFAG
jgi:hypothetical protein